VRSAHHLLPVVLEPERRAEFADGHARAVRAVLDGREPGEQPERRAWR
jgi:hypothetical protein